MTLFRITFLLAAFLLAMASPANATTWAKHTYEADNFSVDFSGPVNATPPELDAETLKAVIRSNLYIQDGGSFVYLVGASQYVNEPDLEGGIAGTMKGYKCGVSNETPQAPINNGEVREIRASQCLDSNYVVVGRFYRIGNWFYQVVYAIPGGTDDTDAEHFRRSFTILK